MSSLKPRSMKKFRHPLADPGYRVHCVPPRHHQKKMIKRIALLVTMIAPAVAGAQSFQPGRLPAASRDSFEVIYQGQPFGGFVMTHTKSGDNVTLVTEIR